MDHDVCPNCHLKECQNNNSNQTICNTSQIPKKESCLAEECRNEQKRQSNNNIRDNNNEGELSNVNDNLPHSDPGPTVEGPGQEITEDIAHILKIIGDNLDATANDTISNDIVLALRSIGDKIDTKIGFQNKSFVKAALGASRINIGQLLFQVLRPQSFVGTVVCTSIQLLMHYKRL